ncbi:MAG: hypothetical protein ACLGIS_01360 [Actinomycetes bacterium]
MPTTAGLAAGARLRWVPALAAAAGAVLLAGCTVDVRDPAASGPVPGTPALATPTITPGYDAEAVAGQDLPFSAGGILAPGVPVGISDGLKDAPGWKAVSHNVAGESQYVKTDGCVVAARVHANQGALAQGDDRESTVALFQYLDPTIQPGYLKAGTLRWGGDETAPARAVEVLVLDQVQGPGGRATTIHARVFATAESSVYVSASCPDAASLAAARDDVARYLPVLPPSA